MKLKADRGDILEMIRIKLFKLRKKVFCKHHKILLERSYDGMAECPKDTNKCSGCLNSEVSAYQTLCKLKESIMNKDYYLRNKQRRKK